MKFILGKKIKMGQIFDKEGKVIPVTFVEAGPCKVTQIIKKEKSGYEAVQIGYEELPERKVKKPQKDKPFRYLKEIKNDISNYQVGQVIDVSIFKEGDKIKVSGISKGKGFQGVVKRWGFSGRNSTHGVKHEHRTLGSVGSSFPERVIKGKKMPGRMGGERITIKNLEIVKIDHKNNILAIKGAVAGRKGTLLEIQGI
ncbi:MAG: 50S ribosomal protein L3 [Minisyncoccia bacterium]